MRLLTLALLATLPVYAQSGSRIPTTSVTGQFDVGDLTKAITLPTLHIHTMALQCKGAEDAVYGKQDGVYYACVHEKEVCSKEDGAISKSLIADFDAHMAEFHAHMAEYKKERDARAKEHPDDPALNPDAARARNQAIADEVKRAKAEGRTPDLRAVMTAYDRHQASAAGAPSVAAVPQMTVSAAPAAPAPAAIDDAVAKAIPIGTSKADILEKLGQPYSRMSGGIDRLSYLLTSGGQAQMEFSGGKLANLRMVPAE